MGRNGSRDANAALATLVILCVQSMSIHMNCYGARNLCNMQMADGIVSGGTAVGHGVRVAAQAVVAGIAWSATTATKVGSA
jgi:hypothetical protein